MKSLSPEKIAEIQTIVELVTDRVRNNFEVGADRVETVYTRHLLRMTDPEAADKHEAKEIQRVGPEFGS